jgi:hypothetical protein
MISAQRCEWRLDDLDRAVDSLRADYARASPYPHIVLDDVLPPGVFEAAVDEFPPVDDPTWDGYLHVNETKFANPRIEQWGPTLRNIADVLNGAQFVDFLRRLTDFESLRADPMMDGGGLHQTLPGGHLNVHTDFTAHHRFHTWRRRVNVLLYLNRDWSPEWGGALELWDADMQRCVTRVDPLGNRMLIFTTSSESFHGHPDPLRCPNDTARRSLALYYFTDEQRPLRRATRYRARPADRTRRFAIWADDRALGIYDWAKSRFGVTDHAAARILERVHRITRRPGRQPTHDL